MKKIKIVKQYIRFIFFSTIFISFTSFAQNEQIADSLYKKIDATLDDSLRIDEIVNFATNTYLNNSELALILAKEALNQSIKINYQWGLANSYNLKGLIELDLGNLEEAEESFFKALEIYNAINDSYGIVNIYNNLALMYSNLGKYIEALDSYIKALKILENSPNNESLSLIYTNLGKLYIEVDAPDKAEEYLNKAKILSINTNTTHSLAYVYAMLGTLTYDKNQLKKALSYYTHAMEISVASNNRVMISSIHRLLGDVYREENNYNKAEENYRKSLKIATELNNSASILQTYNSIGYLHFLKKEYDLAIGYFNKCYERSQEVGFQEGIRNSSLHLSYVYNDLGNFKLAYKYRVIYDNINERTHSNEIFIYITELYIKLEQERELHELQIVSHKKKNKILLSYLVVSALLIVFTALFFIQRKATQRAIRKEKFLNRELTSKAIFLVRKNEIFAKIENILKNKKEQFIEENQGIIQDIINEIKQAQNEEVWQEFDLYFNDILEDFHKKLNADFPKLSVNERKLCSLLRMNMTTKDISSITQQSVQTIDTARSRLRKKLGISNMNQSFFSFLSKY